MNDKETVFWDNLEESEDKANEIQERVIKNITDLAIIGEHRGCFEQSVSIENYYKRGFIKDGDLIANILKEGEQRDNITQLIVDNWTCDYGKSVETKAGIISMYGEGDCGIFRIAAEESLNADDIEQILLKAISNNPENFNNKKLAIYVFAPFQDAELKGILVGDYYEFKGCFEFINTIRGWYLLNYNRSTRLPLYESE